MKQFVTLFNKMYNIEQRIELDKYNTNAIKELVNIIDKYETKNTNITEILTHRTDL